MSTLSGRTAIVTGASSGIGRASAEALARAGYTVFGTSRRAISNGPAQVSMLTCDVTDGDSVSALVSTVLAQTGRIDLLVNNAGIGLLGGAEEFSIEQVQADRLEQAREFASAFRTALGIARRTGSVSPPPPRDRVEGNIS